MIVVRCGVNEHVIKALRVGLPEELPQGRYGAYFIYVIAGTARGGSRFPNDLQRDKGLHL